MEVEAGVESDDSDEELPPEWEIRTDNDGRVYYAK